MKSLVVLGLTAICLCRSATVARAQHRFVLQGEKRLAIVDQDGRLEWEMPWGGIHDLHVLVDGNILVQQGSAKVVEIDRKTRQIVWSYDSATANGNAGKRVEVHSFQPLSDDRLMIAESGPARIIEIDRQGKLLHEVRLQVDHPHPHTDTRLVRKLTNGNYLVCHEGDGVVREYDSAGKVVWKYEVPLFGEKPRGGHGPEAFGNKVFSAVRLPNGKTLIGTGNGHGVIEVTPGGNIVWQIRQHELPKITLAWVTTLEVLPSGNYVVGNCHAGPGNPLLIEIDPRLKQVMWQYDGFAQFGNSVSNSQLLNLKTPSLR